MSKKLRPVTTLLACGVLVLSLCFSTLGEGKIAPVYTKSFAGKDKHLVAQNYDYSVPVKESKQKPLSYFDDAAFLGDSRAVDLLIYTKLQTTKILPYCDVGLNINSVYTKPFVQIDGVKYTAIEALKKNKKKFNKVYLMFGLNELSYATEKTFTEQYSNLVNTIRSINKNAIIYIAFIIPVSKQRDMGNKVFTNRRIKKFNSALVDLCKTKHIFLLDFYSNFENCEGYLAEDAAYDGIHFKPNYCEGWLNLLKTHTVDIK